MTSIPIFSGWHPAFPLSWRFLLVLLLLLLPLLTHRNGASGSVSLSRRGYITLRRTAELFDSAEEQHALLENAEEGNELSSRSSSPTASLPGPHHKQWWIQLLTYILLFIVSTWVGVHYEQPGDVRYRDSIQSAVAHPRRQGYGKQGKLLEPVKPNSTTMNELFPTGTTLLSKSFTSSVPTTCSSLSSRVTAPMTPFGSLKR